MNCCFCVGERSLFSFTITKWLFFFNWASSGNSCDVWKEFAEGATGLSLTNTNTHAGTCVQCFGDSDQPCAALFFVFLLRSFFALVGRTFYFPIFLRFLHSSLFFSRKGRKDRSSKKEKKDGGKHISKKAKQKQKQTNRCATAVHIHGTGFNCHVCRRRQQKQQQ